MIYLMYYLLTFVSAILAADTKCPTISPVTDFNSTSYLQGTWYEIGRYYNNWESRGDCASIVHNVNSDKIIFTISSVIKNKLQTVNGEIKRDARTGFIGYSTPSYTASEGTDTLPIEVLLVDYDKYIILYFCAFDKKNNQHVYTWILSRTKRLDADSKAKVVDFINSTHFLDLKKIIWDHFEENTCKIISSSA